MKQRRTEKERGRKEGRRREGEGEREKERRREIDGRLRRYCRKKREKTREHRERKMK